MHARPLLRSALTTALCAATLACGGDGADVPMRDSAVADAASDTVIAAAPAPSSSDSVYSSQLLPVSMRIPAAWADRWRAREIAPTDAEGGFPGSLHAVRFDYRPSGEGAQQQPLFALIAYRRAEWTAPETSAIQAEEVAARGDTVYVAVVATANPYAPGSREAQQWSALRLSADDVRSRLELR